jgi:hypothetical protein
MAKSIMRIDATVEGHDPLDRAHREIVLAPETPEAKAAGIGMAFLEMIDCDQHRQPGLAPRGVGGPALILQTRRVVRLKTHNPRGDGGPGDVQKPADTALAPALRIERNHLPAGLSPRGIAVIVEQRQLPRGGGGQLVPKLFDAMVAHPAGAGMKEDPGQFPVPKAVIEAFEALEFLDNLVRHPPPAADWEDLERRREQAQHALRLKTALEGANRFGVGVGFLSPLASGTVLQED